MDSPHPSVEDNTTINKPLLDNEAEESDDAKSTSHNAEIFSRSESEAEGDDLDQDIPGLINDESELSDDVDSHRSLLNKDMDEIPETLRNKVHKHKKRNRKREEHNLEDDDYELLYENLGVDLGNRRKKYRRVQMSSSDEGENEIAETLFTADDIEQPNSEGFEPQAPTVNPIDLEIRSSSEGEEVDDFIVDEQGQPVRKSKTIPTNAKVQEAIDIFGADFKFDEFDSAGEEIGSCSSDEGLNDFIDNDSASILERSTVDVTQRPKSKSKKKGIYEIYDPHEIEEKHLTTKDEEIRVLDIPERYQLRKVPITGAEDFELEQEAKWIYQHIFDDDTISQQDYCTRTLNEYGRDLNPNGDLRAQAIIKKIKSALDCIRNRHSDLTFISNYRRELIEPELKFSDLILIYSLDEKWYQLQQHKSSLIKMYNKLASFNVEKIRQHPDAMLNDEIRALQEEDRERINDANSFCDITDVSSHMLLYYSQDIVEMQNQECAPSNIPLLTETDKFNEKKSIKMASRRSFYTLCKNSGLNSLASKFGLSPEQFGENMRESYQLHKPDQFPVEPEDAAKEYIKEKSQFNSPEAILSGARHIVAIQISRDPLIRKCVRHTFRNRSFIFISPTERGKKDIDDNHPCFKFKYIRGKPISDLKDDAVLIIFEAEEHDLVNVKITVDRENREHENFTYLEEIKHLYLRDDFSSLVKKWNDQRTLALNTAFQNYLYPLMVKEIRNILKMEAEQYIVNQCISKFIFMVNVAPYCSASEKHQDIHSASSFDDSIKERRVRCNLIAISIFVEDDLPCFAASLNSDGELESYLKLRTIHKPNSRDPSSISMKDKDISNLRELIQRSHPKVIVLSANGRLALNVKGEIQRILKEFENNDQFLMPSIEFLDPHVPNLLSLSQRSNSEFPDHPPQLRHAISLGRLLQDPLVEYTALANKEEDLLCLQLHSLQARCSHDNLLENMKFYLSRAVADVGVDVNECLRFKHKSHLLSFVPGLGPRKASAMLSNLEQELEHGSLLENRSQLITICEIGATVFVNCAGFIKIDVEDISERQTDSYIEELDGSRVHPETYEWAKKMAVDALEYDDTEEDFDSREAVQKIIRNPEKLRDLDLDAFAVQLEKENFGDKRATLNDIRNELENGCYKDRRIPFKRLVGKELFELLFGERMSDDDLKAISRGKLVTCQVVGIERKKPTQEMLSNAEMDRNEQTGMWICPFCKRADYAQVNHVWNHFDEEGCPGQPVGIRVKLDNGLMGFIHLKNLSSVPVSNPEERVKIGMSITCRILKVNYDRFSLELSCKSADLQDLDGIYAPMKDTYYDTAEQINDMKTQNKVKQVIQNFTKRVVIHPKFKNVTYNESLPILQKLTIGDCIIRPSSRGVDHLTLTWKIEDDIYHHIDIRESNKPNSFSLGKSLWIDDVEYEDLDEILATYFAKLNSNAREIQNHKCYKTANGGDIPTLESLLTEERKCNPSRIPYIFSPCKKFPGKFILAFTPKNKPQIVYITILTEGFRLRGQVYISLAFLLKWFKEHYIEFGREVATPLAALIASPAVSHQHLTPRNTREAFGALSQSLHNTPTPLLTPGGGVMQLGYPTPNSYNPHSQDNIFPRPHENVRTAISSSK